MRKKIIQLPKGYISYSQIQLWKNDRERYKALYFDNRDELRISNKGMEYGKEVASALERGESVDDVVTDTAMSLLPKYDVADKEIKAAMKTKDGEITLLGRPDTMDSITHDFREYKTGRVPWTASKAQNHPQMVFYAMLIYIAYGTKLNHAFLDWIETYEEGGVVKPTGHIQSFEVRFALRDILDCMAETAKVAKEIEAEWIFHVPDPKLQWDGPTEACAECGGWERHRQECVKCE